MSGYKYTLSGASQKAIEQYLKLKEEGGVLGDYFIYFLAREFHKNGQCDKAKALFQEIVDKYPESRWFSLAQLQVRESGETCIPLEIPKPLSEQLSCGDRKKKDDQADCYFSRRDYGPAKLLYQELVDKPARPKKKDIFFLIRLSQAAARSQDFEKALWANRTLRERYPKSPEALEALKKIAFLYQDRLDYGKSIESLRDLLTVVSDPQEKRSYWERIGWAYWRLGQWQDAIQSFDKGLAISETPFLLYWKARSLEKISSKDANEIFKNIIQVYPQTYYALRSMDRLSLNQKEKRTLFRSWWLPVERPLEWQKETGEWPADDQLEKVYTLQEFGLFEDALVESHRWRWQKKIDTLAVIGNPKEVLKKSGDRYVIPFRKLVQEHPDYPLPYADFVWKRIQSPKKSEIDPFLVYAMMRQESRYRSSIVSPAGAIGLLQIMPYTGRRLALKDSGWGIYQDRWLHDPLMNIDLSLRYIDQLSKLFHGRWYLMVASYNAGEHVVQAWDDLRTKETEEDFIEEIPYGETKNYVKKIYVNWRAYRTIYSSD